jgi:hypothetical protein
MAIKKVEVRTIEDTSHSEIFRMRLGSGDAAL